MLSCVLSIRIFLMSRIVLVECGYWFVFVFVFSATVAAAAIEQAQWSQMPSSSQTQQSSSAAANAVAQAQAAGIMGTVTAESYAAQAQAYDAVSSATYQQQVNIPILMNSGITLMQVGC